MEATRCKCGKSLAGTMGCQGGVYESHDEAGCSREDARTWRNRLFWPVADFFRWLAGPAKR